MRIGLDIDGVLANFNPAYIRLLNEIRNIGASEDHVPQRWHYEGDLGFTPDDVQLAWQAIGKSEDFWYNLNRLEYPPSLPGHEVYYITARPGKNVKLQTESWLMEYGADLPTVLISAMKGACAYALNLEVYVDDRLENILDVERASPSTRAYLINRPYNVNGDVLRRADSLGDVLRIEGLLNE